MGKSSNADAQTRINVILPDELRRGIEAYRRSLDHIPSEAEAIRQLIKAGLGAVMHDRWMQR